MRPQSRRGRGAAAPEHVASQVADPERVEARRAQILRAAVKLFSERGFYTTTIQEIAREAGISTGLIYQYFGDKDDVLLLSLRQVLECYEQEIPRRLEGVSHPVARLCTALAAYCGVVDRMRDATILAYRSTKSLRADRRAIIKADETRTNRLLEGCLGACAEGGYLTDANRQLLAYQLVLFCHAWALKHWAFRGRYDLKRYIDEGIGLLVEPFLTAKGRRALAAHRRAHARRKTS